MLITTRSSVPGRRIREVLGTVDGLSIRVTGHDEDSSATTQALNELHEEAEAVLEMLKEAEKANATAVVGLCIDYEHLDQELVVVATGTAVLLD